MPAVAQANLTPVQRRLTATTLALSLACNVAALTLPFASLRKGFSTETFSLIHSVTLMWSKQLYLLSVLVVAFSILFPFIKLAILGWMILEPEMSPIKSIWLQRVERLGKWSMLDVFLVTIILSLASKQFFLGAKPLLGLSFFIVAILLSMTVGEALSYRLLPKPQHSKRAAFRSREAVLLLLAGIALFAALIFPFLRIEDWLLLNREYSIFTIVPALWGQGAWLASILTALFLIVIPLAAWLAKVSAWWPRKHVINKGEKFDWISCLQHWSMLDVFGLALIIFALESDELMETGVRLGALFLGSTLVLQIAFTSAFENSTTPSKDQ